MEKKLGNRSCVWEQLDLIEMAEKRINELEKQDEKN